MFLQKRKETALMSNKFPKHMFIAGVLLTNICMTAMQEEMDFSKPDVARTLASIAYNKSTDNLEIAKKEKSVCLTKSFIGQTFSVGGGLVLAGTALKYLPSRTAKIIGSVGGATLGLAGMIGSHFYRKSQIAAIEEKQNVPFAQREQELGKQTLQSFLNDEMVPLSEDTDVIGSFYKTLDGLGGATYDIRAKIINGNEPAENKELVETEQDDKTTENQETEKTEQNELSQDEQLRGNLTQLLYLTLDNIISKAIKEKNIEKPTIKVGEKELAIEANYYDDSNLSDGDRKGLLYDAILENKKIVTEAETTSFEKLVDLYTKSLKPTEENALTGLETFASSDKHIQNALSELQNEDKKTAESETSDNAEKLMDPPAKDDETKEKEEDGEQDK